MRGGEWISRSSFRRSHIARLGVVLTQLGLTQILLSFFSSNFPQNRGLTEVLLRSYSGLTEVLLRSYSELITPDGVLIILISYPRWSSSPTLGIATRRACSSKRVCICWRTRRVGAACSRPDRDWGSGIWRVCNAPARSGRWWSHHGGCEDCCGQGTSRS